MCTIFWKMFFCNGLLPHPPHKLGLIPLSEPVGGSAPKFATASKGSIFVHAEHEAIVQLCPAQASPLPTFR